MKKYNFTEIAKDYQQKANVQKSNSDRLIEMLDIQQNHDVLDVGCGPGHITKEIRNRVNGYVLGMDPSQGMINEANKNYGHLNIEFQVQSAEEIDFKSQFDIIFISSAFQWFKNPEECIRNFYSALRNGGKIGIQAPATQNYCPMFIKAINQVKINENTQDIFSHYKNPWFFLETTDEYSQLFQKNGFQILLSELVEFKTKKTPKEIYSIFSSGAIAGYLNQEFYDIPINPSYINDFEEIVQESFRQQCPENSVCELMFNRIFLIAKKE
ncbi:MAG: methyltransferase domain-containing protein [Candidatus Lokiarchaeota archaeon]|nr:methyltransferase domain-containing protein [Candidatus Lokiarchaeota archaeon]